MLRWGTPLLTVALATAANLLVFRSATDTDPFGLYYAAVIFTAWYGGLGPGLWATAFAVLAADYFFLPKFFTPGFSLHDLFQVTTFAAVALIVSSLNERRKSAMAALRANEASLLQAKQAAEAANRAKDRFLAVLSHELRTPLTPALAAMGVMETDPRLPTALQVECSMVRRNIELEARLIDDLLDVTRIARGKLPLNWQDAVDVHGLVHDVLRICRGDIDAKHLRLTVDLQSDRCHVRGDPARVAQILWNLVKNAIKFTYEGGQITIRSRNEPGDGRLDIEVQDTGIGIPADLLPRLFNAFEQGEATITREFGGLGLGLAISKALADAHGGALVAMSQGRGHGATFRLELPTVPTPPRPEPLAPRAGTVSVTTAVPPPTPPEPVTGLRVLLVEDHDDTRRLLSRLLRSCGHHVTSAGCVQAALEAARRGTFDIVVSDIGLPDGTGLDVVRGLRDLTTAKAIALSGFGMEEDLRQSREAGFVAHLVKPVSFDLLRATIDEVVRGERSSSPPPPAASSPFPSAHALTAPTCAN
jgi:hypothetical protein